MRASRFGWMMVAAVVAAPAWTAPAAAEDVDLSGEHLLLYEDTLWHIADELAYLVANDKVRNPVPEIGMILAEDFGLVGVDPEERQQTLDRLEHVEGPALLDEYDRNGLGVTDLMWDVLWPSDAPPIDATGHLVAYDDALWLWWNSGGSELDPALTPIPERIPDWLADGAFQPSYHVDPSVVAAAIEAGGGEPDPAAVPPVSVEPDIVEPAAERGSSVATPGPTAESPIPAPPGSESASIVPWLAGGGVAAVIAVGLALWGVRRRRRGHPTAAADGSDDVLEAGRRFLTADTLDELGARVAEHAQRVSGAAGAVFTVDDHTWSAGSPPALPADAVERAGSTGRTQRAGDDAVVAVLSSGRVVGIIGVAAPSRGVDAVEHMASFAGERLANVVEQAETEQLAFMDSLTSVPNRRRFDLDLSHHSKQSAGGGLPVAVAMIDVDHFKAYNDTNGHQEGDDALRAVARLIGEALRAEDTVYRYGGEEFAVLLPGADLEAALGVAERIRANIEAHRFRGGPNQPGGRVTVSIGVSATPPPDGEVMVEAADAALYRAKTQGRNQVVLAADAG